MIEEYKLEDFTLDLITKQKLGKFYLTVLDRVPFTNTVLKLRRSTVKEFYKSSANLISYTFDHRLCCETNSFYYGILRLSMGLNLDYIVKELEPFTLVFGTIEKLVFNTKSNVVIEFALEKVKSAIIAL